MARRGEFNQGSLPVPTPREVNEAAGIIGEDVAWDMTGGAGFSEASPDQLRAIVAAAKEVPLKGQDDADMQRIADILARSNRKNS